MATAETATVFLETSLGTRLVVSFPARATTVADLKRACLSIFLPFLLTLPAREKNPPFFFPCFLFMAIPLQIDPLTSAFLLICAASLEKKKHELNTLNTQAK